MHTTSGTSAWCASITAGWNSAAAVPLVHTTACYAVRNEIGAVWFKKLRTDDGSIVHTGDNLTGEGEGDDESIIVELDKLSDRVQTLVFTVNSFSSQGFSEVANASCRLGARQS